VQAAEHVKVFTLSSAADAAHQAEKSGIASEHVQIFGVRLSSCYMPWCLELQPTFSVLAIRLRFPSCVLYNACYLQFQKQSGGGGIDSNINDSICEVLEGGAKPTGARLYWFITYQT
jgi:hypothetical protein